MPATYTFGGGSATGTFTAGQAGPTVSIASTTDYPGTSTFAFAGVASASGTLVVTEAHNRALGLAGDVTPDTLPVVTALSNSPMLYFSFYNGGTSALSVTGASLTFTTDASSIFGSFLSADVSCGFSFFDPATKQWPAASMVNLSTGASTFTVANLTSAATLTFPPGQILGAIACD